MTQQVVRARTAFTTTTTFVDAASFDTYWEATGSNTSITNTDVVGQIDQFLNTAVTGMTRTLAAYLSPDVSRSANLYSTTLTDITAHLDGTPAGTPFYTFAGTIGAAALGQAMPGQCAAVCGYRRDYGTDLEHGVPASLPSSESAIDQGAPATHTGTTRPRARDRGRFYLGPLNTFAFSAIPGTPSGVGGQLHATFLTDLGIALNELLFPTINNGLANQLNCVQWSRRNASVQPVRHWFVSEACGIIRKREDTTLNRVHAWHTVGVVFP